MSKPARERPSPEEIQQVKDEGRRLGWLRSRLLHQPWPRQGVCACGRARCAVCNPKPDLAVNAKPDVDAESDVNPKAE
jgi:hypothetical protein